MNTVHKKYHTLQEILENLQSAVIAFSGGVDSTFLLRVAKNILKENIIAVTFRSEIIPQSEIEEAQSLVSEFGVRHIIIGSDILHHEPFIANDKQRCYYCKKIIFSDLSEIAKEHNLKHIIEGSNADDAHDYRPGRKVLKEMNILSPLAQAGLTKEEIRKLSRKMGLPTWNKPALACLATRIPYGTPITKEKIKRISKCEQFLHELGFEQVRVRDHETIARIEIPLSDISELIKEEKSSAVTAAFKNQGFKYICADIEGYRTGSMNEVLNNEK